MASEWADDAAGPAERKELSAEERKAAADKIRRGFADAACKAMGILERAARDATVLYDGPDDSPSAVCEAWELTGEARALLTRAEKRLRK